MARRGALLPVTLHCLLTFAAVASAQLLDGLKISKGDPGVAALIKRIHRGRGGFGHNQPPPPPYVFDPTDTSAEAPAIEVVSYDNAADAIAGLADSYHLSTYLQAINLGGSTYDYLKDGSRAATYFLANDMAMTYGLGLMGHTLLDAMLNPALVRDILAYNTVAMLSDYGKVKNGQKMSTNFTLTKNNKQIATNLQVNVGKLNSVTVKCTDAQNFKCPIKQSARVISGGVAAGSSMVYIISGLVPPPAYTAPARPKKVKKLIGGILNGIDNTLGGLLDNAGIQLAAVPGKGKQKVSPPPPVNAPPPPSPYDFPDIVTALQAQSDLSSYYNALVAADLSSQLNEMPFNFTIFAPSNSAMDALMAQLGLSFGDFLQMKPVITAILQSTVVLQDNLDKEHLVDGLWLQALNGKPLLVTRPEGFDPQISTTENSVDITTYDISVGDDNGPYGNIHITDFVLLTKPFFDNK